MNLQCGLKSDYIIGIMPRKASLKGSFHADEFDEEIEMGRV